MVDAAIREALAHGEPAVPATDDHGRDGRPTRHGVSVSADSRLAHSADRGEGGDVRLPATFRSLRIRNYRLWFSGQVVSVAGTWTQTVALAVLVLELSDDN